MKIYFHLSCVAGRDLYPAPQIADDLFGIFIIGFAGIIFAIILSDEGGGSGSGGFFSGSSSDSGSGFSSGGDFGGFGGFSGGGGATGGW